jgi:hypothetical protein
VQPAGQQRHDLGYVQQRDPGRVGLYEVHYPIRRRPATHHGTDDVWIDNGPCTGGATTPPPTTAPPTTQPPTTPPPTTAPPTTPPPTGTQPWVANHAYTVGTLVTYAGHTYKCLQSHTSQVGWEPPNVPALWQLVS